MIIIGGILKQMVVSGLSGSADGRFGCVLPATRENHRGHAARALRPCPRG